MTSEPDQPRQRTVAELLAENGNSGATGRRRRRRETDEPGEGGVPTPGSARGTAVQTAPDWWPATPPEPDRSVLRDPVPPESPLAGTAALTRDFVSRATALREAAAPMRSPAPEPGDSALPVPLPDPMPSPGPVPRPSPPGPQPPAESTAPPMAVPGPPLDRATEQIPRISDLRPVALDPGVTGPIHQVPLAASEATDAAARVPDANGWAGSADAGPATMVAAAPGDDVSSRRRPVDAGPPTQAAAPLPFDDDPAGLEGVDLADDRDGTEPERAAGRGRAGVSAGQAWAAVVAQWVGGAIGGAVIWMIFSFLWQYLVVVALAAATLVTVGLVVVVRSLLHNDDRRTTVFAVLVGLLLTVSPAVLIVLGNWQR